MAVTSPTLSISASHIKPAHLQHTRASTATTINSIGNIVSVGENEIRYCYNPSVVGSGQGWLLESATENLLLQSEDFTTTWTNTLPNLTNLGSITAGTALSPDGTSNASSLAATGAGTGILAIRQTTLTPLDSNSAYTVSVFAKKKPNGSDYLEISNGDNDTASYAHTFNLSTGEKGTATGSASNINGFMRKYPNGWYRCEVTYETGGTPVNEVYIKARNDNNPTNSYTVTANDAIYIWGAQVEKKNYATSYVATLATTSVRAADNAYVEPDARAWNHTVGMTIVVDATLINTTEHVTPVYHYEDMNNAGNYVSFLSNLKIDAASGGTDQFPEKPFTTNFSAVKYENIKIGLTLAANNVHAAMNGSLSTNTYFDNAHSFTVPENNANSSYRINLFNGAGLDTGSGYLRSVRVYPTNVNDISIQNSTFRDNADAQHINMAALHVTDGSIGTGKLTNDAVTSEKIGPAAITAPKMAPDSVVEACIVNGAVTENKIAANSITSAHLKLDVILAEDIANNAVTWAELANNAVIKDKIANNSVDIAKLDVTDSGNAGDVLKTDGAGVLGFTDPSSQAVGGDLSGTVGNAQIGANKIGLTELNISNAGTTGQILSKNAAGILEFTDTADVTGQNVGGDLFGTIANATIANDAVTGIKISDATITEHKYALDSISTGKLQDNSVDSDKLGSHVSSNINRAVSSDHIKDLNITVNKLAVNSVTADKISSGAVGQTEIAGNSIVSAHIVNGTIIEDDLADNAVTANKILDNAVTTNKIYNGSVNNNKLGDLSVSEGKLQNLSVSNTKIAANAITTSKINNSQVDVSKLNITNAAAAGQVLSHNELGQFTWIDDSTNVGATAVGGDVTGTVSNITIPTGAITSDMLGVNVIVAEDVANNAITIAELNVNSVDLSKLVVTGGAPTAGQILSHDGNGDFTWVDDTDTTIGDAAVGGMVSGTISNVSIAAGVVTPTMLSATGTANNTTFLRGDGVWATPVTVEVDPTAVTMAIALG